MFRIDMCEPSESNHGCDVQRRSIDYERLGLNQLIDPTPGPDGMLRVSRSIDIVEHSESRIVTHDPLEGE